MRVNFDWFPCEACKRYCLRWFRIKGLGNEVYCTSCGAHVAHAVAIDAMYRAKP